MKIVLFVFFFILAQSIKSQNTNHSFHLGFGLKLISVNATVKYSKVYWPTSTLIYSVTSTGNSIDYFPSLEGFYQFKFSKLSLQSGINISTNFDNYLFQLNQRVLVKLFNSNTENKWSINLVIPEFSLGKMLIYDERYFSTDVIFLLGSGLNFNFSDKVSLTATYSNSINKGFYTNSYGGKEDRYEKKINGIGLLNFSFFMKL
jgi:hypothetical protein